MNSAKYSWSTTRPIMERAMHAQEDLDQFASNMYSVGGQKRSSIRGDSSGPISRKVHSPRDIKHLKNSSNDRLSNIAQLLDDLQPIKKTNHDIDTSFGDVSVKLSKPPSKKGSNVHGQAMKPSEKRRSLREADVRKSALEESPKIKKEEKYYKRETPTSSPFSQYIKKANIMNFMPKEDNKENMAENLFYTREQRNRNEKMQRTHSSSSKKLSGSECTESQKKKLEKINSACDLNRKMMESLKKKLDFEKNNAFETYSQQTYTQQSNGQQAYSQQSYTQQSYSQHPHGQQTTSHPGRTSFSGKAGSFQDPADTSEKSSADDFKECRKSFKRGEREEELKSNSRSYKDTEKGREHSQEKKRKSVETNEVKGEKGKNSLDRNPYQIIRKDGEEEGKALSRPEEIAKLRTLLSGGKSKKTEEKILGKPYSNQTDVEVLSVMHEKDLEILDLKNHILKYELEFKQMKDELRQKSENLKNKESVLEKLKQERDAFERDIEYLKKSKSKLEVNVKELSSVMENQEKNSNQRYDDTILEKNLEIHELKKQIRRLSAEKELGIDQEKKKYTTLLQERESQIISNKLHITRLEEENQKNSQKLSEYVSIDRKLKELEEMQNCLIQENINLKGENKTLRETCSMENENKKAISELVTSNNQKIKETESIVLKLEKLLKKAIKGEEPSIEMILGLRSEYKKSKDGFHKFTPKVTLVGNQNDLSSVLTNVKTLLSENESRLNEVYKHLSGNINEAIEIYTEKCGEECNIN